MKKITDIQNEVFDFLIAYRNDDERLSIPYLKLYNDQISICHFLYFKKGVEIKVTREIIYTMDNKIFTNKLDETYSAIDNVNLVNKKTSILKVYEYFNSLLNEYFNPDKIDKLDKEIYYLATGETLKVYFKLADFFTNNFLK